MHLEPTKAAFSTMKATVRISLNRINKSLGLFTAFGCLPQSLAPGGGWVKVGESRPLDRAVSMI